jgi:hypothetical protein
LKDKDGYRYTCSVKIITILGIFYLLHILPEDSFFPVTCDETADVFVGAAISNEN